MFWKCSESEHGNWRRLAMVRRAVRSSCRTHSRERFISAASSVNVAPSRRLRRTCWRRRSTSPISAVEISSRFGGSIIPQRRRGYRIQRQGFPGVSMTVVPPSTGM
jgi:hypothetical protein